MARSRSVRAARRSRALGQQADPARHARRRARHVQPTVQGFPGHRPDTRRGAAGARGAGHAVGLVHPCRRRAHDQRRHHHRREIHCGVHTAALARADVARLKDLRANPWQQRGVRQRREPRAGRTPGSAAERRARSCRVEEGCWRPSSIPSSCRSERRWQPVATTTTARSPPSWPPARSDRDRVGLPRRVCPRWACWPSRPHAVAGRLRGSALRGRGGSATGAAVIG